MSPSLTIQMSAGHQLTLVPVPMSFLPRSDPNAWNSFVTSPTGSDVPLDALNKLQSFLDANNTDAVTDGKHFYTVNAGLSYCTPEQISNSVLYELRINGETFMTGDESIRMIFQNLSGENFVKPRPGLMFSHAEYLSMMEREFSFQSHGAELTYHVAGNDTALRTHTFQPAEVLE